MSDSPIPKIPEVTSPPLPNQPPESFQPQAVANGTDVAFTPSPETVISTASSRKVSLFKIFIVVALIIIVVVYAAVIYLYLQNKKSKETLNQNVISPTGLPVTNQVKPFQIKIKNGNVIKEVSGEEDVIIVAKSDYSTTGITGFIRVSASPDNSKICFEALPPAPGPAIYIANIDGTNVVKASDNRQGCTWDKEGKSVFYTNISSKTTSVNIYQYDIAIGSETDLTSTSIPKTTMRQYKVVGLSADSSKLVCQYEDVSPTPIPSLMPSGQCEIDLTTREVQLL